MGLSRLLGLCLALLSFSALAADPPTPRGNVSTTVNATTGYHVVNNSTIRTPPNVNLSPAKDITPHVSRYSGGLQQTLPAGITINGVKESGPLGARVRASTQTLKGGAKTLLKGNLATLTLGAGIQQLLNGVSWVLGPGGKAQLKEETITLDGNPVAGVAHCPGYGDTTYGGCKSYISTNRPDLTMGALEIRSNSAGLYYYAPIYKGASVAAAWQTTPFGGSSISTTYSDLSDSQINDTVDSNYTPEPSDWQNLAPHFTPDDVEIINLPSFTLEPTTTTDYDANGNPTRVRQTTTSYELEARDNPSPEPKLDLKEKKETKTYEDGQLTGSSETTSTIPAAGVATGGGSQAPIELEIPTDCDFMPTVCAFLEWFKEPNPELEQEQDLSQLINDVDYERNYSISFGENSCPAPIEINVIFLNQTIKLSYEPACQLAVYAKPFVLISAYIFAIFITLGVVRNG